MNINKIYTTIGASNHINEPRQAEDYYATHPMAIDLLVQHHPYLDKNIWEPACGEGHMSEQLKKHNFNVFSSDLIEREYGDEIIDFLTTNKKWHGDIITNPPYKHAKDFILKALDITQEGKQIIMFLKLTFMEGQKRKNMFIQNPPKVIYVSSSRIICAKNGDFNNIKSSAIAYAWYVWEKGYKGNTIIKWIN